MNFIRWFKDQRPEDRVLLILAVAAVVVIFFAGD